jgi:hypothetical protein
MYFPLRKYMTRPAYGKPYPASGSRGGRDEAARTQPNLRPCLAAPLALPW